MNKDKIKAAISLLVFVVMVYMEIHGFWFAYLLLWFRLGLPLTWWSMLLTVVLACASTWGIKVWIERN